MSSQLRIFILIGIFFYYLFLFLLMKKKKIAIKYALVWIADGAVLFILDLFPGLAIKISKLMGIEVASNAIFLFAFFAIILVLISLTSIVSSLNEKAKELIQNVALLEKRVRDLENKDD